MNRFLSVLAVTAFLVLSACGGTKSLSPAAEQGNTVIHSLQDLSRTYEKKNLGAFMRLFSGQFKNRKTFRRSVQSVFSKYDTVRFTIQYARMFIMIENRGMTRATFNWDSEWRSAGGRVLKNSGRAAFVFDPKNGKLLAIEGRNPFIPRRGKR